MFAYVNQARPDVGATPLLMACVQGHAEVVAVLLDKARDRIDVNQARTDTLYPTPLSVYPILSTLFCTPYALCSIPYTLTPYSMPYTQYLI